MGDNDEPEGTEPEDGVEHTDDPPDEGDGEQGQEQDAGQGDTHASEDTPPANGGGDGPDLAALIGDLGTRLEGAVGKNADELRGEMAQLRRETLDRIELAEARYGRAGAIPGRAGGGPDTAAQQGAAKARSLIQKIFW